MRLPWTRPAEATIDVEALTAAAAERAVAAYVAEQQATREKMAELAAQVQRASQTGMMSVPSANGADPPLYARDHPWWFAVPQSPARRPRQTVNVATLRQFAQQYDILRAMINHLRDAVEQVPMQIVAQNDSDQSEATKARIKKATAWFDIEGGLGGEHESRAEFQKKVIEELHVVGVSAIYLAPTRGGGVHEALSIDASTIRPRVDLYGWPGPGEDHYEQWIEGIRQRGFRPEEMYWKGLYPRSDSPYPDSPVEYLVLTTLTALKADEWNRSWLTTGTEPGKMVALPKEWTPNQVREYSAYFLEMLQGNIERRQQVWFVPGDQTSAANSTRREYDFQAFEEWLARRVSAIIGVQMASIGFPQGQYATTQAMSVDQTMDVGVAKLLAWFTAVYNYLLRRNGYEDLECRFVTDREEAAGDRADRLTKLVAGSTLTPNEARAEEGLDPMEGGDVLFVSTTLQPLERALNPPEPTVAPGTESSGDQAAAQKASQQQAKRAALARWERLSLAALEETGSAEVIYRNPDIPKEERLELEAGQRECRTPEEVQRLFAAWMGEPVELPPIYHTTQQQAERQQIARRWRERRLAAEREE